jgi:hypothetical protein
MQMNYQRIYDNLIDKAKYRVLENGIYYETHHILPRCLKGTDDPENLVALLPEEHYVAHQLLVKLYPGHYGIAYAALLMTRNSSGKRQNNKMYGWVRKAFALSQSLTPKEISEEGREKMREAGRAHKGVPKSEETRRRMSEAARGRQKSAEHKESIRLSRLGTSASKEAKQKMSETQKNIVRVRGPGGRFIKSE